MWFSSHFLCTFLPNVGVGDKILPGSNVLGLFFPLLLYVIIWYHLLNMVSKITSDYSQISISRPNRLGLGPTTQLLTRYLHPDVTQALQIQLSKMNLTHLPYIFFFLVDTVKSFFITSHASKYQKLSIFISLCISEIHPFVLFLIISIGLLK